MLSLLLPLLGLGLLTPAQASWPDLMTPAAFEGGGQADVALIVAIGDYAVVPDVSGAVQNGREWFQHLHRTRGVPVGSIRLLTDNVATREKILDAAASLEQRLGEGGTFWVIFVGHGAPYRSGEDGLLLGWDVQAEAASVEARSVRRSELVEVVAQSKATSSVVILDACFSGQIASGASLISGLQFAVPSTPPSPPSGITVLTAGTANQYAGPLPELERPAFSYLVLGAMRGWGDQDQNGVVTAEEAVGYADTVLASLVHDREQTPTFSGTGSLWLGGGQEAGPDLGDLVLAVAGGGGEDRTLSLVSAKSDMDALLTAQKAREATRLEQDLAAREQTRQALERQIRQSAVSAGAAPDCGDGGDEACQRRLFEYHLARTSDAASADEAFAAAQKAVDVATAQIGELKPEGTEPVPLNDWEQRKLDAIDRVLALYPDSLEAPHLEYAAAYLLYERNHFDEAATRFRLVIIATPGAETAEKSANLIMDSLVLTKRWSELRDTAGLFYDLEGLGSPGYKQTVAEIYESAWLKAIEADFTDSGDETAVADDFWAFYSRFPDSKYADFSLNNSAVYYAKAGAALRSMVTRHVLLERFPKSKFAASQALGLGYAYESIADFREAARWYERGAEADPTLADAPDALYSAGLFRQAAGDWEQAVADFTTFVTRYPDDPRAPGVKLSIGLIYEGHQRWSEAAAQFQPLIFGQDDRTRSLFASLHYGIALEQLGRSAEALAIWREGAARLQPGDSGIAVDLAAEMMFRLQDQAFATYINDRINLTGRETTREEVDAVLGAEVLEKAKALQQLEVGYSEVVQTGAGGWGMQALLNLGEVYLEMGEALRLSDVPAYLNEQEVAAYHFLIAEKVIPQNIKARKALEMLLEKSHNLQIYGEVQKRALEHLAGLAPEDWPQTVEALPAADRWADTGGSPGSATAARLLAAGQPREALDAVREALLDDSSDTEAFILLARINDALGEAGLSRLAIDKALTMSEARGAYYNNQAVLLLADSEDMNKAIALLKEAIKLEPGCAAAHFNLAALALGAGDWEAAAAGMGQVLKQHPGDLDALLGLAVAQRGLKEYAAARESYRRAIAAAPENPLPVFAMADFLVAYMDAFDEAAALVAEAPGTSARELQARRTAIEEARLSMVARQATE